MATQRTESLSKQISKLRNKILYTKLERESGLHREQWRRDSTIKIFCTTVRKYSSETIVVTPEVKILFASLIREREVSSITRLQNTVNQRKYLNNSTQYKPLGLDRQGASTQEHIVYQHGRHQPGRKYNKVFLSRWPHTQKKNS